MRAIMDNELSRIPQSFTFDVDAIDRKFASEAPIIRDIIVYAARSKMRDLWGDITFTIDEFCNEFGHNRTNLQRTLKQFRNVPDSNLPMINGDPHPWDGLFEYALYRALNENIVFSRKRNGVAEVESYQIIEKLTVHYKNKAASKKREKRAYSIQISDKLAKNLLDEYFLIDYEDYKGLTSSKISSVGSYRNFYLFMSRMIATTRFTNLKQQNEKKDYTYIVTVDEVCKILNINFSQANDKKKHITKILGILQKNLKKTPFTWQFVKHENRHAYHISFTFAYDTIIYFDEKLKTVFIKKLQQSLTDGYVKKDNPKYDGHDLYLYYKAGKLNKDDFIKWFFNSENKEIKEKYFRQVYQTIYHTEYVHDKVSFDKLKLDK